MGLCADAPCSMVTALVAAIFARSLFCSPRSLTTSSIFQYQSQNDRSAKNTAAPTNASSSEIDRNSFTAHLQLKIEHASVHPSQAASTATQWLRRRNADLVPWAAARVEAGRPPQGRLARPAPHLRQPPRDAGGPLKVVQELLGHATIEMTMRDAHLAPRAARVAVKLLDAH